ncbi:MAG: DUF3662 and FHA domain-containing protein [Pelosinus sp.]|nr:DUF3662 and FHA domain-containing protein [Pelosinus sp.]
MGVKFVRNLESIFEKYIEGFFNKKFSSGLQPVEIAKQLVKEMELQKNIGVSNIYVPNSYVICLCPEDYERIAPYGEAVKTELIGYLAEDAEAKDYTILGMPVIEMRSDVSITKSNFKITSSFTESIPKAPAAEALSDTRVFTKVNPNVLKFSALSARLTVIDGFDSGLKIEIGTKRVNIGRREGNELPLSDASTSRLHAYVAYEDGAHVLYDAKSLNGTYVDDRRITRKTLQNKNRIKVGSTMILYEVN